PASDQYALAMVVYGWLCGKPAFQGEPFVVLYQQMYAPVPSLRQQVPTIAPEVEPVVLKALMKDPEQRFESVRAFAQALAAVLDKLFAPPIPLAIKPPPPQYPHLSWAVGTRSDPGIKR